MLSDLVRGDYIVHVSHGIGVFDGIVPMEVEGVTKDYIKINYAGADVLYVPVTQLDLVSKYIGPSEDKTVRLSRLNSAEWTKTRSRVSRAVKDMAADQMCIRDSWCWKRRRNTSWTRWSGRCCGPVMFAETWWRASRSFPSAAAFSTCIRPTAPSLSLIHI